VRAARQIFVALVCSCGIVTAGAAGLVRAPGERPTALVAADFDEDGVQDLVSAFAGPDGTATLIVRRGNIASIFPQGSGKAESASPFLAGVRTIAVKGVQGVQGPVDFLGAGDFDADGHFDLLGATRGGASVSLWSGDGKGSFAEPRALALPGRVTAFVAGEIDRADGLADFAVGVAGAGGPRALVFESPLGAFHAQAEAIGLPAEATALALGSLDEDYPLDLAVAGGNHLVIVHGRDRMLSLDAEHRASVAAPAVEGRELPYGVAAMALGELTDRAATSIALLAEDGMLHVLDRAEGGSEWSQVGATQLLAKKPASISALVAARVSASSRESLIAADPGGQRVLVLSGSSVGQTPSEDATLVLPMRLNKDALADLVVLRPGATDPQILLTAPGTILTVNTTVDSNVRDTVLTLREAMMIANGQLLVSALSTSEAAQVAGTPANPGLDEIRFNIPGAGVQTIAPTTTLPSIAASNPITIDGYTQPGSSVNTLAAGDNAQLKIELAGTISKAIPINVIPGGTTIRGLVLNRFSGSGAGIQLQSVGNNIIEGNFIGIDASGTTALGNGNGVILGNIAGTGPTTIGGTAPASRNVISGNTTHGILDSSASAPVLVVGNFLGTNAAGTAVLPAGTGTGSGVNSSKAITIGGTAAGSRNLIAGNRGPQVVVLAGPSLIQGNYVGTDVTGNALPSGVAGIGTYGVQAAPTATIGGTTVAARNVIAGNNGDGVYIPGASDLVQGNYIGVGAAGNIALGNTHAGVYAVSSNNTIGGAVPGARNVISATVGAVGSGVGVQLSGSGGTNNVVQGNYIGTDATGTQALGNQTDGVYVFLQAAGNKVGGTTADTRNVISGNGRYGVRISGSTGTTVQGNSIGVQPDGTTPMGNGSHGIFVTPLDTTNGNARSNVIGGTAAGAGNVIAHNAGAGVFIDYNATYLSDRNAVRGNSMFQNGSLGIDLLAAGSTPNDNCDVDAGANTKLNFPVITAATPSGANTTITGTLNSTASSAFTIDLYSSPSPDGSQFGEGRTYVGSTTLSTNGTCTGSFSVSLPTPLDSPIWSATALDVNGNTSEFSADFLNPSEAGANGGLHAGKGLGNVLDVSFTLACGASDHALYWHNNGAGHVAAPLTWSHVVCALGLSGSASFDTGTIASGALVYFVVVGQNSSLEGSYGLDANGNERPQSTGLGTCDKPQVVGIVCP
jgi:hypothetical protein